MKHLAFKPSKYQIFLSFMAILIIFLLLNPQLIFPNREEGSLRIGIVDSGCSIDQSSEIAESKTFTSEDLGYSYTDTSIYDSVGHGRFVCDIILDGTDDVAIYSARIANANGELTYSGLFAAVEYLVVEKEVDIINLSLGGEPYFTEDLLTAFEKYADNVVFVAAIGNKANDFNYPEGIVDWPATLPWVVGVGAAENTGTRSVYSSFGRGNTGIFSTEFTQNGRTDDVRGTSFSAPRITVAFANLWQQLESENMDVTPELLNYYLAASTNNEFNPETGWGVPLSGNFTLDSTGVLIQGVSEIDEFIRFSGERWTTSWKITGTIDNIDILLSGNGTGLVRDYSIEEFQWGKMLSMQFANVDNDDGIYEINIAHPLGNNFSYFVNATSTTPEYKILLDHRNTVNGFAHTWGSYSNFEKSMRIRNIQVDQIHSGTKELTNYDSVLLTEFGKKVVLDREFKRPFNQSLFEQYLSYTKMGGNLQIFTTYPENFNTDNYTQALQRIGGEVTEDRIPNSGDIKQVSNFSRALLYNGVIGIGIGGQSINPVNASSEVIGWYKAPSSQLTQTNPYRSIGINTTLGDGTIHIWSGSVMLQNEFFINRLDHFDQYLLNYLNFYV